MHHVESPCIDSIVLDTPWNRRSKDASRAALEPRAPWPLAAPEPAAISPALTADADEGANVANEDKQKHAPMFYFIITT